MATRFTIIQPHLSSFGELQEFKRRMKRIVWTIRIQYENEHSQDVAWDDRVKKFETDYIVSGVCISEDGVVVSGGKILEDAIAEGRKITAKQRLSDDYLDVEVVRMVGDTIGDSAISVWFHLVGIGFYYGEVVEGDTRLGQQVLSVSTPSVFIGTPTVGDCCYYNNHGIGELRDTLVDQEGKNDILIEKFLDALDAPVFDRTGGILGIVIDRIGKLKPTKSSSV